MMNIVKVTCVVAVLFLFGCATSGTSTWANTKAKLQSPGSNKGRVIVYTNRGTHFMLVSDILLDGKKIGEKASGEMIIVDTAAGEHMLSLSTEAEKKTTFRVNSGETKYFRVSISPGVLINRLGAEPVDSAEALRDLTDNAPYFEWKVQALLQN